MCNFFVRNEAKMKVENGKFYFIKDEFFKFNITDNKHYFKPIYLKPDIYCKEKIEDIQYDRDITLEKAIEIWLKKIQI